MKQKEREAGYYFGLNTRNNNVTPKLVLYNRFSTNTYWNYVISYGDIYYFSQYFGTLYEAYLHAKKIIKSL